MKISFSKQKNLLESTINASSMLTKKQKRELKQIILERQKEIKEHFSTHAWDLDAGLIISDIVYNFLKIDLTLLMIRQINDKCNVSTIFENNKIMFKNETDKLFYSPIKNRLYVDTQIKDVNNDVLIGDI